MKVRNFNRLISEIEQWKQRNLCDDITWLSDSGYGRELFPLQKYQSHWKNKYNEVARNNDINHKLTIACKEIMIDWNKQLYGNYEKMYLATWLFPYETRDSQIVAAVGSRAEYYRSLLCKSQIISYPRLYQRLSQISGIDIKAKVIPAPDHSLYEITLND
jgi:hypothetical protein